MKTISSMHQRVRKRIALGLIILLAPVLFLAVYAIRPIDNRAVEVTIYIPKGAGFFEIAAILDHAGMVKHKLPFVVLTKLKGAAGSIKPGEYELSTALSPNEIINKLYKGEIKIRRVTIPEDFTLKQIADRLIKEGLVTEAGFLSLSTDPAFLASLDIDAVSAEGYLYPDTYDFHRGMAESEIIRKMVSRFREKVTPEMIARASQLGLSDSAFVTLASLIGKETGHKEEKARISAVFHNRLKRGMKLQSDPTAVYRLDAYRSVVRRKDLDNDTSYNTYKISGLPPGPIANPGIDSLQAVLHPAPVKDLYFVSKNDGTHVFSSNLAEHAQAVLKYQIKRKKE
jgi:UPF0755 protein